MPRPFLLCHECRKTYSLEEEAYTCFSCGQPLLITYDPEDLKEAFDRKRPREPEHGVWRFRRTLPFPTHVEPTSLGEGDTYLTRCERLERLLGLKALYIKNESTNPTGSFIDRGSTILVTHAKQKRCSTMTCASTGNLGSSLAAYAAKAGVKCRVYIPYRIDLGKLYQMIAYGAEVKPVKSVNEALETTVENRLESEYAVKRDNPYPIEGYKTISYEVVEQLRDRPPDRVIVPMGSGGLITALWKGMVEMEEADLVNEGPMLTGVQENICDPIVKAYQGLKLSSEPVWEAPLAVDLCVSQPTYVKTALKAIKESKGAAASISDREIVEAAGLVARTEGIFAESAAASTIAGLKKLLDEGVIDRSETVVCVVTGEGLKDPSITRRMVEKERALSRMISRMDSKVTRFGETKLAILSVLNRESLHGYGIWRELKKRFKIRITPSGVYQHLTEMELTGMLRKCRIERLKGRPERICYALTEKGKKALVELARP